MNKLSSVFDLGRYGSMYDVKLVINEDKMSLIFYKGSSIISEWCPLTYLTVRGLVFMNRHNIPIFIYEDGNLHSYFNMYTRDDGSEYLNNQYEREPLINANQVAMYLELLK